MLLALDSIGMAQTKKAADLAALGKFWRHRLTDGRSLLFCGSFFDFLDC